MYTPATKKPVIVQRPMEEVQESFHSFLLERFPPDAKRSTSAVIRASFDEMIVGVLKDPASADKSIRFFVKKHGFQLLNLPSLGVQEVLVVPVNEDTKVK